MSDLTLNKQTAEEKDAKSHRNLNLSGQSSVRIDRMRVFVHTMVHSCDTGTQLYNCFTVVG